MNIVKLISDKTQELADNGTIDNLVTKHVTSCINDIVKDAFTWSGEGKKALEKAISEKLHLPLENINIDRYNLLITKIVENQINGTALEVAKDKIKEVVNSVTEVLDKKQFTLSEIIAKYIESIDTSYHGGMEDQHGELSFHINKERSFTRIYFDKDENKEHWECDNVIGLHDDKIYTVKSDGDDFSPFTIAPLNGFDTYLFKLYANNVEVIIDEDKIETSYYREDCN